MLVKGSIFARMSPDQKQFLVQNLQAIGYVVGFCGDGTNDCGALKAADIGLSLSEAEASVAAPFTSQDKDLRCVLSVIREGRVALVTSFCCFKYMALYSLIQFSSVSILYSLAQNIGDFQFMYIDLCIIIPIAVFMGQTGPHVSIYRKRPTASLVSAKVLTSIIGQTIISFSFQYFAFRWVQTQPWYIPGTADIDNQRYQSFENSIVFLVSCYQYITAAIVFTVGPPYQASIWKNSKYIF
jgi:cation-transporting ATPase 13A3/4/5